MVKKIFILVFLSIFLVSAGGQAKEADGNRIVFTEKNLCIGKSAELNKRKAPYAIPVKCDAENPAKLIFNDKGYLQSDNLCIDPQEKDELFFFSCSNHPGKVYEFEEGKLKHPRSGACIGFNGDPEKKGTLLVLLDCKDAPTARFDVEDVELSKIMGVTDKELPRLGKMPFQIHYQDKDLTIGQVTFMGKAQKAVVFSPNRKKKKILSILPKDIDLAEFIPSLEKLPISRAQLSHTVINVVVNGSEADEVSVQNLPGPLKEVLEQTVGGRAKVRFQPGLTMMASLDTSKSAMKKLANTFGVKETNLLMNASLSPYLVTMDHNKVDEVKTLFRKHLKAALSQTKVSLAMPKLKLPVVSHVLEIERSVITFAGDKLPVISGAAELKLPGKTIPIDTKVQVSDEGALKIFGSSDLEWDKPLSVPFLTLKNVGVQGEVNIKKKAVVMNLTSTAKVGREEVASIAELAVSSKGIEDVSIALQGEVDVARLDGFNQIPGIKEFSFSDLKIGTGGIHGEMAWKRFGIKRSGALVKIDNAFTLLVKADDLSIDKLVPNLPPMFKDINLPGATLFLSSRDLRNKTIKDMPEFVQKMLSDISTDPDKEVPIFNGLGLLATLDEKNIPGALRKILKDEIGVFDALDGPLVLGGAVADFFGKLPSLAVFAELPGFKLPKNQPLARIISFDKVGADFFMRLIPANTVFQAGVGGQMVLSVPQLDEPKKVDKLKVRGEVIGSVDLVSVAGSVKAAASMKGKWNSPFGISENIAYQDPAFVLGVDTEGSVEIGVGGTTITKLSSKRTLKAEGDMLVNINFSSTIPLPKKLGARFAANEMNIFANLDFMQALFKGVLTGPMANAILAELPANERAVAKKLQEELRKKDTTMASLLQIDKLPFPMLNFKNVELMFATPGAYIPGRDTTQTFGAVIAGEMEMHLQGKVHKIGKTENRITMADGLILKTEVKGSKLGPLALDDSHFNMVASLSDVPVLELKTGTKIFNARTNLDVKITPLLTTVSTSQKFSSLLDFDFKAFAGTKDVKEFADFAKADFRLASSLKSDPQKWLQNEGLGAVKNVLGGLNAVHRDSLRKLDIAKAEVSKLNNTIAEQRRAVRNERRSVTDALNAAKREVSKIENRIRYVNGEIRGSERSIRSCNQTIRICTIWFFGCRRHETIPNFPERAWCEAKNTPHRLNIARLFTERTALQASEGVAQLALDAAKAGTNILPVDADPRVSGPIAARDVAMLGLDAAKLAVSGADVFNDLVSNGVNVLKVPASFKLEKGIVKGSLQEAVRGKPVVLEIDFTSFGKRLNQRLAFSLTDVAFNVEQMSVLALGLVTNKILEDAKNIGIIPHSMLAALENIFLEKSRQAESNLIEIIESNGGLKQSSKDAYQAVAFQIETKRRVREIKEKVSAKRTQDLRNRIYNMKANQLSGVISTFGEGAQQIFISSVDEVSGNRLCLEAKEEKNGRGANRLAFEPCSTAPAQTFILAKSGEVRSIGGRCIDPQERGEMWLYTCTGHPGMKWRINDFKLQNQVDGKCIRGVGSKIRSGTPAETDRCQARSSVATTNMPLATIEGTKPVNVTTFTDKTGERLCLEATDEKNKHGSLRLIFNHCANTARQNFGINDKKQIVSVDGRCIDPQAKGELWLHNCVDKNYMSWDLQGNLFKNQKEKKCIRALGEIKAGAPAELDTCGLRSAISSIDDQLAEVSITVAGERGDLCLAATEKRNKRDAIELRFDACRNTPSDKFVMNNAGNILGLAGLCVDYQEGNELWLYDCSNEDSMQWDVSRGQIKNKRTGNCIRGSSPSGGRYSAGAIAVVEACATFSASIQ